MGCRNTCGPVTAMQWMRENAVLALGISLPLLLMLVFMGVRTAQEKNIAAPAHAAVFAVMPYYGGPQPFVVRVGENGRLSATFMVETAPERGATEPVLTIYKFDPAANRTDTYTLKSPRNPAAKREYKLDLPNDLATIKLSAETTAPDGYRLDRTYRGSGNLMTDLFGYNGSSDAPFVLTNGPRRVTIPGPFEYGQEQFIGWVTE